MQKRGIPAARHRGKAELRTQTLELSNIRDIPGRFTLAARGVPIPVIERLLNHISGTFSGAVGVYQREAATQSLNCTMSKVVHGGQVVARRLLCLRQGDRQLCRPGKRNKLLQSLHFHAPDRTMHRRVPGGQIIGSKRALANSMATKWSESGLRWNTIEGL